MPIWIRSQDKKRLIEVNDFKIEKREIESTPIGEVKSELFVGESEGDALWQAEAWLRKTNFKFIRDTLWRSGVHYCCKIEYQEQILSHVFAIASGYTTLGTYSTEEKALKVLDRIFEAVEQGHNFIMPSDEVEQE